MMGNLLKEKTPAPDFALPDADGKLHKLSDYRGKKVVLYFYPKDDTPGCTKESCDFRDGHASFEGNNAVILGVSLDNEASHKKFQEKYDLPFTLLADKEHKVSESYGVYGEKQFLGMKMMGITRTTYIIDEQGIIKKVFSPVKVDGHALAVRGLL